MWGIKLDGLTFLSVVIYLYTSPNLQLTSASLQPPASRVASKCEDDANFDKLNYLIY